jgi:NLI interacting factor-like phosphatase
MSSSIDPPPAKPKETKTASKLPTLKKIHFSQRKSLKSPVLIIFDINGTLLERIKNSKDLAYASKSKWQYENFGIYTRPYAREMLEELRAFGYKFGLWTTMNQSFAVTVGQKFITPPFKMEFTIGGHFCKRVGNAKVKDLSVIFNDLRIDRTERWADHNTILVDDTKEKGRMNADNMIVIPTFDSRKDPLDLKLVVLLEYFKAHWSKFEQGQDVRSVLKDNPIDWGNGSANQSLAN